MIQGNTQRILLTYLMTQNRWIIRDFQGRLWQVGLNQWRWHYKTQSFITQQSRYTTNNFLNLSFINFLSENDPPASALNQNFPFLLQWTLSKDDIITRQSMALKIVFFNSNLQSLIDLKFQYPNINVDL